MKPFGRLENQFNEYSTYEDAMDGGLEHALEILEDRKENNIIFIIEKLWFDSLENTPSNAVGYSMVGYVTDKNAAIEICENSRTYTSKDCWAIMGELQEYKYKKIRKFNK